MFVVCCVFGVCSFVGVFVCLFLAVCNVLSVVDYCVLQFAICCLLFIVVVAGYCLLCVVCNSVFDVRGLLFVLLVIVCWLLLFAVWCLLFATCCLVVGSVLFVVCCV